MKKSVELWVSEMYRWTFTWFTMHKKFVHKLSLRKKLNRKGNKLSPRKELSPRNEPSPSNKVSIRIEFWQRNDILPINELSPRKSKTHTCKWTGDVWGAEVLMEFEQANIYVDVRAFTVRNSSIMNGLL